MDENQLEPKQRAHSPQLEAGLASEIKTDSIPSGRRFPAACSGDLQIFDILKDILKINSIIATELIQLVENSSAQLRGEIPGSCKTAHMELRKDIVRIAEKWNKGCEVLRSHNIRHE